MLEGVRPAAADTSTSSTCNDDAVVAEANIRSARARARWGILRTALLGQQQSDERGAAAAANSCSERGGCDDSSASASALCNRDMKSRASIHRFGGFKLIERRIVPACSDNDNGDSGLDETMEQFISPQGDNADGVNIQYECAEYSIDVPLPSNQSHRSEVAVVKVRTRERKRNVHQRVDIKSLLSHRHHGVDNTGQARVWDSESTLTHCLLRGSVLEDDGRVCTPFPLGIDNITSLADPNVCNGGDGGTLRVIELGAGMAGLAGLSLAALGMSKQLPQDVAIDVTLTDGHPEAVGSNRACSILTSNFYELSDPANNDIACKRLLWNHGKHGAEECSQLTANNTQPYQLCLASDCTHFQEFHAALAATIGRLLSVGGICILCQPKRANSLDRFMTLIDAMNAAGDLFEMTLHERYDDRLWKMHQDYVAEKAKVRAEGGSVYDPSIHYPLLLVLRKRNEYSEDVHTGAAVRHMRERDV